MKKIIALMLSVVLCFSLVACGGGSQGTNNATTDNNDNGSSKPTYVGTWVHEKTDAEAYYFTFTLKDDGTGAMGRQGKSPLAWSENGDGTITINMQYSDGSSAGSAPAKLLEDGKLQFDYKFTFSDASGNPIEIETMVLERS